MTKPVCTPCRPHYSFALVAFCLVLAVVLTGCGGPAKATVTGKVTYKKEPVKGGTIVFGPIAGDANNPGKPATATVQADGTFTLTTDRANDGAIIGKHNVSYTAPEPELTEAQRTDPKYNPPVSPYAGLVAKTKEVEVKAGVNSIEIELGPAPAK